MAKIFCLDDDSVSGKITAQGLTRLSKDFKGGETLEITFHHYNGDDMNKVMSTIPNTYDAVVFDNDLGNGKTGIDFARELREKRYNKPIIIYSLDTGFSFGKHDTVLKELDLHFVNKRDGKQSLHDKIQSSISQYKNKQPNLPNH